MKKVQKQKLEISSHLSKRAQEEMVGFALIIILVSVILLVFLLFALKSPEVDTPTYKSQSFISSVLHLTSDCEDNLGKLSVQKLIIGCSRKNKCSDERVMCEVLEFELKGAIEAGWNVGVDSAVKGYSMNITQDENVILSLEEGEFTGDYREPFQPLGKDNIKIFFAVYE